MENIHRSCNVCQRDSAERRRFKVSLPGGDCVFNPTFSIDIMTVHRHAILLIVDRVTKFKASVMLRGESMKAISGCMTRIWFHQYMGIPDVISDDQGPQFISDEWRGLLQLHGITSKASGVKSHNTLGTNERYHTFLKNMFSNVLAEDPSLYPDLALWTAVKAVNDTASPPRLVPTLLLTGTSLKFRSTLASCWIMHAEWTPWQTQKTKWMSSSPEIVLNELYVCKFHLLRKVHSVSGTKCSSSEKSLSEDRLDRTSLRTGKTNRWFSNLVIGSYLPG